MKVSVLGTGEVGRSLATGLIDVGHDVTIAGRDRSGAGVQSWLKDVPKENAARAHGSDYAGATSDADVVFLCVRGQNAIEVATALGDRLSGKILVDVTNPLTFPPNKPMELSIANTDSQAEQLQRALPGTQVVKALNIVNSHIMTHPREIAGDHFMPIAGNDAGAKQTVTKILQDDFGWPRVIDLGDVSAARGMEAYLHLWLRLWGAVGHARFNIALVEHKSG